MDWIPAISTTSLFTLVLWLFRSVISTRLTKSVQHEFDSKIQTLQMELRKSEESFKADIRNKETQIEALRSGAISGLANRQIALDKRRIDAVDQLWSGVVDLGPAKMVSTLISAFNYEGVSKLSSTDPQVRKFFADLEGASNIKNMQGMLGSKARPFVSQIAWAIFSAYRAIVFLAVTKLYLLKAGLDVPDVLKAFNIIPLIQVALPHQIEYVEKGGDSVYHQLLEELEFSLLKELDNILKGVESDKESVERAAAILKESDKMMKSISKSTSPAKS